MNLTEAIKSGRHFRRVRWHKQMPWCLSPIGKNHAGGYLPAYENGCDNISLDWDDLLADDWELKEPTVTITRTQFWEAISWSQKESLKYLRRLSSDICAYDDGHSPHIELARRLGLEL